MAVERLDRRTHILAYNPVNANSQLSQLLPLGVDKLIKRVNANPAVFIVASSRFQAYQEGLNANSQPYMMGVLDLVQAYQEG